MKNQRLNNAQNKRARQGTNSEDFITGMPDEILILVLSLLSIKDAVVTSSVSKRFRFMWTNSQQLNFDYSGPFEITTKSHELYFSEREKYYNQVNSVIRSYNHPKVHFFRINFHLDFLECAIDDWLEFAANRKVEILELDLETADKHHHVSCNYNLPIRFNRMTTGNSQLPYSDFVHLKKLYLKNVSVSELALSMFLEISKHLETLSIHRSANLANISVRGRELNLKHFEIVECPSVASIYLSDFNLESFTYMGGPIGFSLTGLPNLKNVVISQGLGALNSSVFRRISSCASSLQALSLKIFHPMVLSKLGSVCQLPNVKKLTLAVVAQKYDYLLEFVPILNAFPNLETFIIELLWSSVLIKRRREPMHIAADHPHEHLKVFKILGYYGRISDAELAAYMIDNSNALRKIVIDPRCQVLKGIKAAKDFKKNEEAARSSAQRQLPPLLPPGVELVIL